MSKPYFAKYLPVEGEVKPADASIDNEGNIVENTIKEWLAMRNLINLRKVKLFLCSRDIQVGDKFFHPHDFTNAFIAREDTIDWHSAIGTFKAIGEISPEATWVKEGDEFDEEEVRRKFPGTPLPFFFSLERWKDILKETEYLGTKEAHEKSVYPYIYMKCPTCGHFH